MNPLDPTAALPHDLEAEKAILSAVMMSEAAMAVCVSTLTEDHFYSNTNAKIWRLLKHAKEAGNPIDLVALLPSAMAARLDVSDLAEIFTGQSSNPAHFAYYLKTVSAKLQLRRLYETCYKTLQASIDPEADPQTVIGTAKAGIELAETSSDTNVGLTLKELWLQLHDRMTGTAEQSPPIPTGITLLDRLTRGGPRRGQMVLLGGLRHTGKTALARWIALNNGATHKVLCFFAESSNYEESSNTMAVAASVPTSAFAGDARQIGKGTAAAMLRTLSGAIPDVRIDTDPNLTCDRIEAKCRLLAATKGIDVVFVDYLQFMSTKSRPGQNREQLVADDARRLKILARQLDIVIYLLVQLNDEIAPEQEPLLSHLRESKGPANHADCVLLISAPDGIAHDPSASEYATAKRLIWNRKWRGSGAFNKAIQIEFRGATQQFINPTI